MAGRFGAPLLFSAFEAALTANGVKRLISLQVVGGSYKEIIEILKKAGAKE